MSMMLITVLLSLSIFALVMLGLSLGWLIKKKPLKGSCGGLNATGAGGECRVCGAKPEEQCQPQTDSDTDRN